MCDPKSTKGSYGVFPQALKDLRQQEGTTHLQARGISSLSQPVSLQAVPLQLLYGHAADGTRLGFGGCFL